MSDHLFNAANDIVPKCSDTDMRRVQDDLDRIIGGGWDTPRARMYIAVRMADLERSLKVMNVKCKLLEAIRGR